MDLNERKMQILKSIVDEYISKGEPVGSKHLVEYGKMSLSPATIRNEMSELEEMGYLDKPHTSAGRIPSNAAYRIYVEQLMENYRLNVEELNLLNELTRFKMDETDKLVEKAAKVISEITNCAAMALMTGSKKHVVKRFDTLLIDEKSFVLVMVMPDDTIKTQHLRTQLIIDEQAVKCIKDALNSHLSLISLDDVSLPLMIKLEKDFGRYSPLVTD
ncbi:MAG: heat-inducible transcription repressor HrcA, partial [Clostridia bacterium]|nr:heat-inducible transcription repressor HrcA [Clostridia bacterium]